MNENLRAHDTMRTAANDEQSVVYLDDLLSAKKGETRQSDEPATTGRFSGVVIGTLVGLDDVGGAIVDFPGNPADGPVPALSTVPLERAQAGREVALMFELGDPRRPLVLGLIQHAQSELVMDTSSEQAPSGTPPQVLEAEVDRERLVLTADKEVVLRCGKASITLTRAGKVLIRGAYLLCRSSGVNRIKGGSVQIN